MAAAAGQAAGLAVGAAVGSIIGQPAAGAAIGSGAAGFFQERGAGKTQAMLDREALELNRTQARLKASESSAIHAANFRQALASQISLASMRGGTGSLVSQFGQQAYGNFLRDQRAIEAGLDISEAKSALDEAGITAKQESRDIAALSRFAQNSFTGINTNLLRKRDK